jgi:hypothetical protein
MSVSGTSTFTITAAPREDTLYLTPTYTFRLKIMLADYTSRIGYIQFTVIVNRYTCISSTVYTAVTDSGSVASSYAYTIGSGALTFTAPAYTTGTYTCGENVTYSLSLNPSGAAPDYVTFNSVTRVVTINTTNTALTSNVSLRITITRSQGPS